MKPGLNRFKEVARKCRGNISAIANYFDVYRTTVYNWMEEDERFKEIVYEYRGRLLDKCIKTAELLANGIPTFKTTEKGPQFTGWKVQPNAVMLRYLISSLGRNEGFGEFVDTNAKYETVKQNPIAIEVIDRREQVRKEE